MRAIQSEINEFQMFHIFNSVWDGSFLLLIFKWLNELA